MRVVGSLIVSMLMVMASSIASAQSTRPAAAEPALKYVTQQELDVLRGDVQSIRSEIISLSQSIKDLADRWPAQPASDRHVTQRELDQAVGALRTEVQDLRTLMFQRQDETNRLLEGVAYGDGKQFGLRLKSMVSNNPGFRTELEDVVRDAMPQPPAMGTLVVENRLWYPVTLRVNRADYYFAANETRVIPVELGTATAHLVNFEAPKNWFVGAPSYSQRIVIGNRMP